MYDEKEKQFIGYIYLIENLINHKYYVGQTNRTVEERFNEHIRSKDECYLHRAIRKYGKDAFIVTTIEELFAKNIKELSNKLNEKEIYWINFYKTFENGYNMSLGGENAPFINGHKVDVYLFNGTFVETCDNYIIASNKFNVSYSSVKEITSGNQSYCKSNDGIMYVFRDHNDAFSKFNVIDDVRTVYKFDSNGNLIKNYRGAIEAAKDMIEILNNNNLDSIRSSIDDAIRNERFLYGYFWSDNKDYNVNSYYVNRYGYYQICQYDKDTKELLNIFRTIKDASFYIKGNYSAFGAISNCCKGKSGYAFNSIWRYNDDDVNLYTAHKDRESRGRKINCYKDNVFICTYNSSIDAAECMNINKSHNITNACRRKNHLFQDYYFYYADDPMQPDKTKIISNETIKEVS